MNHNSFSDEECVRYVFSQVSAERAKEIEETMKHDEILQDFITSLELSKTEGRTAEELLQKLLDIPPPNLRQMMHKVEFEEKYGKPDPR